MQKAKALRDEYTRTLEPARVLAAEALALERAFKAECRMKKVE